MWGKTGCRVLHSESRTVGIAQHFQNVLYMCVYRFQNAFLRCPTPRFHCFLSSHWPSFRFLSFMAFLIASIHFFFGLPRAVFCFSIHFNAILGNLPYSILWTWPYYVSWFWSISFIIVSSSPICCLIVTFLILSFFVIFSRISYVQIIQKLEENCSKIMDKIHSH